MNTDIQNHRVILRNTRNVKIERKYGYMGCVQISSLIAETHAMDNGLRVTGVWHSDGSRCQAIVKAVA